ncbi:ankyrin repeat-containing domain protein [Boletus coccyginus]|nr:ankyrin repeat-containing domain protein [Boletus coccyginus]
MERSRKFFRKIASASRRVVIVAKDYADRKDSNDVPPCHFQLEEDMQRISVACERLEGILDKPLPKEGPAVNDLISNWFNTGEPQECLRTLSQMKRLLQRDFCSRILRIFRRGRGSTTTQDKIKEAIDLFNSCERCFHFLFSTEEWNNERVVQEQQDVPRSQDHIVQGESNYLEPRFPVPIQTEINTAMPLDPGVHGSSHAEHITQGGSNIVRGFPAPVHADISTTIPETVDYKDGNTVTQGRQGTKTGKQRGEEEKKLDEISKWLDGLNCAEKQDVTLSFRQKDTCKWLFDTTQYKMWKDSETGAGKSVLASFAIDSFKMAWGESEILGFFYCDFRNERSTSSAELLQLRGDSVDLGNLFDDLVRAKKRGGGTLNNAKELAEYAARAAGLLSRRPVVVVDALDECKDVQKLLQALMVIRGRVRLFVTSQPLQVIMDGLLDVPCVSMEDMTDTLSADIELHVTEELNAHFLLKDLDSGFKTEICSVLCDKADGMFRWVQCSIDALGRCGTQRDVREALASLPKGLDETYERILLTIDTETPRGQLAQRALIWLVAALRPLRLSEIMEGLSVDLRTRTLDFENRPLHNGFLLDACRSLVTYTERTGIIILSHSSVKEYLTGKLTRAKLPKYHISWERAHLLLARSCMCYISIYLKRTQAPAPANVSTSTSVSLKPLDQLHPTSPLLEYALHDAFDHFEHLGSTFESALDDVTVLAEDMQRHSWIWDNACIPALGWSARWERGIKPHWPRARHDLLLYVLVAFAPDSLMSMFFRRTAFKPKEGTNPLVYAAHLNKTGHASTLLLRGAKLNHRGWETREFRQSLPIEVAFQNQHYDMVTLFVREGSTVPLHIFTDAFFKRDEILDAPSGTLTIPSFDATALLQADEFAENINSFLNDFTLRAMKTSNQLLVFKNANEGDLFAIIRRFIQVVEEESTAKSIREAFVRFAVAQGHFSVAQYLLNLDTRLPSDVLVTLHQFSGRWKTAPTIQFLVDNGANVLAQTSYGESALHTILRAPASYLVNDADEDDILKGVKLLVSYGCDCLEADSRGNTPLLIAVERSHISIARYLLTCGATLPPDLLVTLDRGWSRWGTEPTLNFLVENGVDVLVHASNGDSVVHIALQSFYDDNEALEIVKLLVKHVPMMRFLVENGVDVLVHASNGDSMLHIALQGLDNDDEALETVKALIGYGCDPLEANPSGKTPLRIAVEQGHTSTAQHLLTLGAHLPPDLLVTFDRNQSSHWVTAPMIRFLVENGVDMLAHSNNGDSVLHMVLQHLYDDDEALKVVKLLVDSGSDPLDANPSGKTPLHIAVEQGHTYTARYLLTFGACLPPDLLVTSDHEWSRWGTAPMIRFLVENGVDILAHASNGDSVLHIMLKSLYWRDDWALEIVKLLVNYGCDPLQANSCGNTPLHIAVERGYTYTAQYLLTFGARLPPDLLVTLDHKWPVSRWGTAPMIRFLIENGVNPLAHASNGDSVLHIMLAREHLHDDNKALKVVKLLVDSGSDPLAANPSGKTPLHIAVEQGHTSTARYLLTHGARLPPDLLVTLDRKRLSWGKAPMIRFLVENGVNILAHSSNGDSVLHMVLQHLYSDNEALKVVKLLVSYGCDPLEANPRGDTPLCIAVKHGHISTVRHLLTLGAHLPPGLLVTFDHRWSRWGTAPMIHFLVKNGVDILAHASDGDSVLHIALQSLYDDKVALETVKVLVGYGCDPLEANPHGVTPLHIAVQLGQISTARYLLTLGAHLPPGLFATLDHRRSRWGTAPMIRFLVENGVDVLAHASDGDPVLHIALQSLSYDDDNTLEMVKVLVGYGCNPLEANPRGVTPLHIAVQLGQISTARYLLTLGARLPPDLLVSLNSDLSSWSTLPMIRFLVENAVNLRTKASDRDSVLHTALRCFNDDSDLLEVVEFLVGYGCDPLEANSRGETPLHIAAKRNYVSAAQYLIAQGASVLTKASNGDTVLHFAAGDVDLYPYDDGYHDADERALEAVEFLVGCGCEPATPNDNGETPLHIAVRLERIKTIKYLLSLNIPLPHDILFTAIQNDNNSGYRRYIIATLVTSGCDTRTPNSDGDTPLRAAIVKGHVDVVEYLLSVMSEYSPPLEDLLSATALAPPSVQSEMKQMLSDRLGILVTMVYDPPLGSPYLIVPEYHGRLMVGQLFDCIRVTNLERPSMI